MDYWLTEDEGEGQLGSTEFYILELNRDDGCPV